MSCIDRGRTVMSDPCEHGGQIHRVARRLGIAPADVLDFSSSLNPLGPPAGALALLAHAGSAIAPYPDNESFALRQVLAQQSELTEEFFLFGNGSTELIYLIPRVFRPETALIAGPTFSEYERASRLAGTKILQASLNSDGDWGLPQGLANALQGVALCFLCNPNNPSGTVIAKSVIADIIGACPETLFVVDEAFIDFLEKPEEMSVQDLCAGARNLIVLRSFTKFYAMAGLRLGYALAHPSLIERLRAEKEPWTVNTLAQEIGECVLSDHAYARCSRQWIGEEREWLARGLTGLGLTPAASSRVNFLLLRTPSTHPSSSEITRTMEGEGILLRDASNFRGLNERYLRIAVKSREANERLLFALRRTLGDNRSLSAGKDCVTPIFL